MVCVCTRAQTSGRRVRAQACHCLRDRCPHEHRPGARTREPWPGQWEALGKSCYCVFWQSYNYCACCCDFCLLLPLLSVNLFPLVSSPERPVFKNVLDSWAAWLTLQRTLGVQRRAGLPGVAQEMVEKTGRSPGGDLHSSARPGISLLPSPPTVRSTSTLNQWIN